MAHFWDVIFLMSFLFSFQEGKTTSIFKQFSQWPHHVLILMSSMKNGNYLRGKFLRSKDDLGSGRILLRER